MAAPRLLSLATWTLICAVCVVGLEEESVDARLGAAVTLACRPPAQQASAAQLAYYWLRSNAHHQHDNVAVGAVPLQTNYRVQLSPQEGRYDLLISNATYERDNGRFECRVKAPGSGVMVHAAAYSLVVLVPPGAPQLSPAGRAAAREGAALRLACSSRGGSPQPELKWYREGSPYPLDDNVTISHDDDDDVTTAALALTPTREEHGARYRCVVWNRALPSGDQLQDTVELSVDYYPRVSVGPSSPLAVPLSGAAQLQCAVDARPPPTSVRWLRRGAALADGDRLALEDVSLDDAGDYECEADNGLGVRKATLTLDVQHAPRVSLPDAAVEVDTGGQVRVRCAVVANPPPLTVEWLKEGAAAFRQRGDELRLSDVSATDAGTYTCRATNAPLTADGRRVERTATAALAVLVRHAPGPARVSPAAPAVAEGGSVALTCAAEPAGWPAPQYRWFRAEPTGAAPAPGSGAALATGALYAIAGAHLGSEGRYYCQATNELGHGAAGSAELRVQQPPRFTAKPPAHVTRRAGEREWRVACSGSARPPPSAAWLKDGRPLPAASERHRVASEPADGAFTTTLILADLQPDDAAVYTCVLQNELKKIEAATHLRIEHEPMSVQPHSKVAADPGETATLECRVRAYPEPEFSWHYGTSGGTLPPDTRRTVTAAPAPVPADERVSRLTVRLVRDTDYGEYRCEARNTLGSATTVVVLQRKGAPDAPRDLRAVATAAGDHDRNDHDHVTLRWTPGFDGGLAGTKYFVSYRRAATTRQRDDGGACAARARPGVWAERDCARDNPCNVTALEQHVVYEFKVKAVNTMGQSEYSNTVSARTRGAAAAPRRVRLSPDGRALSFTAPAACVPRRAVAYVSPGAAAASARVVLDAPLPPADDDTDHQLTLPADALDQHDGRDGSDLPDGLRLKLCLQDEPDVCSDYTDAEVGVSTLEGAAWGSGRVWALAAGGATLVLLLAGGALLCRRRGAASRKARRLPPPAPQPPAHAPPPYYPPAGQDNAALDHAGDSKQPYPPYHHHYYAPAHQTDWAALGYGEGGAGRAGSEHSQDSLWQLKQGGGAPAYYALDDYPPYARADYCADRQPDYCERPPAHAPALASPPADYCVDPARRDYCADPYASVHKPKKRNDQLLESPYHEVSGLPTGGAGAAGAAGEGGALSLSYDESLESGYSTPNSRARRVIREIIV